MKDRYNNMGFLEKGFVLFFFLFFFLAKTIVVRMARRWGCKSVQWNIFTLEYGIRIRRGRPISNAPPDEACFVAY